MSEPNSEYQWVDPNKPQAAPKPAQQCTKVQKKEEASGVWVIWVVGAAIIGCFLAAVGLVISFFVGGEDASP